jgi:PAS domain S-box-containing protein
MNIRNKAQPMEIATEERNRIRILIADDHLVVREGLVAILKPRLGFEVVAQARDGREAIDLFCDHRPDITLMDLRMPSMDGLAAIRAILADCPEARIIVLTAFAGEEENSLRAGAKAVVPKDASREELLSAIREQSAERLDTQPEQSLSVAIVPSSVSARLDPSLLHDTFASMSEAMIIANDRGRILFLNPNAERLTGWTHAEAQGQEIATIYNAIEEESGEVVQRLLLDIAEGREVLAVKVDMLLVAKGGSQVAIEDSAAPVKNRTGETTGVVVVFRDVGEQREARRRLEAFNQRLRQAMTETHHRVKNNLQVTAALVELHQREGDGGLSASAAQTLSLHIRSLAQIHDFLNREAHPEEPDEDFISVSVRDTMAKLIPMVQATLTDRLLSFTGEQVRLPAKQSSALALIVNELISNALKHGSGDIDVVLAHEDGTATLEVMDKGPGFPEGFDSQRDAHTGLGLIETLVRIDLNGEVRYTNRPEGGGCIIVRFPSGDNPTIKAER